MILTLCFENFVSNLSEDEIIVIDTIVSKMEYSKLLDSLKNKLEKSKIDNILKLLIEKKMIITDNDNFFKKDSKKKLEIEKLYSSIKSKKNYFEILEIRTNSGLEEIKTAFFKLSKKFHPDYYKKNELSKELEDKLAYISIELGNMYNILKVKHKRREYIKSLNFNRVNIKLNSTGNIKKGKIFYNIAYDEFNKNSIYNSLKNIQLSLHYDKTNKETLILYEKIKKRKQDIDMKNMYISIENLLSLSNFEEVLGVINNLEFEVNDKIKKYQIKAWNGIDAKKYKDNILKVCKEILDFNDSTENYELYLSFLKKFDDNRLQNIAKKMLEKYPKNKIAKSYIKKRSIWNIF